MTAVAYNNALVAKFLIEMGANKEVRDENNRMAIQHAKNESMQSLVMMTRKILAEGEGIRV